MDQDQNGMEGMEVTDESVFMMQPRKSQFLQWEQKLLKITSLSVGQDNLTLSLGNIILPQNLI